MSSTDPRDPAPRPAPSGAGTKVWVGLVTLLLLFFAFWVVRAAVVFIAAGGVLPAVIGGAVILVVLVGLVVLAREIAFGVQTERLARILEAEGGLPVDDLPRSCGGRIDRAAADAQFPRYAAEAEAAPRDWRARYRLSLAYDAAGDRSRARAAAREAVRLHRHG